MSVRSTGNDEKHIKYVTKALDKIYIIYTWCRLGAELSCFQKKDMFRFGLVLWCLSTLSTIFQEEKWGSGEKNNWPVASHWQTLSHWTLLYTPSWSRLKLTTTVVMGTDCIGSCKSNYHTITATMVPLHPYHFLLNVIMTCVFLVHVFVVDLCTFL